MIIRYYYTVIRKSFFKCTDNSPVTYCEVLHLSFNHNHNKDKYFEYFLFLYFYKKALFADGCLWTIININLGFLDVWGKQWLTL